VLPVANFKWVDHEGIEQQLKLDVRDSSKLDEAVEIVQKTNDQVIIFSNFNEPMKELAFRLQVEGISSAIISSETASKMGTYETD
jgi:superfamily II DNA/RNA helicase